MPNPPSTGLPNPASYDTSTPGVVQDKVTGLMWQRRVNAKYYTWVGAEAYCANLTLAQHNDWRVPNEIELFSLVDYTNSSPDTDTTAFPNTPVDSLMWSSSLTAKNSSWAWGVPFYDGLNNIDRVKDTNQVRCVRGGAASQGTHYTVAKGTVKDNFTGLTWQRTAAPGRYTWSRAQSHCANLGLAGGGWRVPSAKELMTLVDFSVAYPGTAIDTTAFPNVSSTPFWSSSFWSSSPLAGDPSQAWYISFNNSSAYNDGDDLAIRVRCVR